MLSFLLKGIIHTDVFYVRLWSTWDLKPVREITFSKSSKPIIRYIYISALFFVYNCGTWHLIKAVKFCGETLMVMSSPVLPQPDILV